MQLGDQRHPSCEHRLLVYGTLMRGERNHALLNEAKYIEGPLWVRGYELRASHSYYPYAFFNPESRIRGEFYWLSHDLLTGPIDRLEGVEEPYYTRYWDAKGQFYIYVKTKDNREDYPLISPGDWIAYRKAELSD